MTNLAPNAVEAAQRGQKEFRSSKPCKYGHLGRRRVDSGACVDCYELKKSSAKVFSPGTKSAAAIAQSLSVVLARGSGYDASLCEGVLIRVAQIFEKAAMTAAGVSAALNAVSDSGLSDTQLRAALSVAPIQTGDGKLWALTLKGRAAGRASVAALMAIYEGEAMNAGLVEPFGISP